MSGQSEARDDDAPASHRAILLGVGNTLGRDDGVGVYVALHVKGPGWDSYDCGTAPENFTGLVRRNHPPLVLIIDAAEIGSSPGDFRIVDPGYIPDVGIGTHQFSLGHLLRFLSRDVDEIFFIGIQPADLGPGEGLSPQVRAGADALVRKIMDGSFRGIPPYIPSGTS